jgi:hypothetical protein
MQNRDDKWKAHFLLTGIFLFGASGGVFYALIRSWNNGARIVNLLVNTEGYNPAQSTLMRKIFTLYWIAPALGCLFGIICLAFFALARRTAIFPLMRYLAVVGFVLFPVSVLLLLREYARM